MRHMFLFLLASALLVGDSFRILSKRITICEQPFQNRCLLQQLHRNAFPTLSMGYESDDNITDDMLFDEESSKPPLEQFLDALDESIRDQTLLKLTLTENESANSSDNIEVDDVTSSTTNIDWQQVKEWAAINGRLIKTKSESRVQLICYKDKSMKNSGQTKNYATSEDVLPVVSAYIRNAFKKGMLSTRDNDFEIKMKRGQGKFRATSKGFNHVDAESVLSENIAGLNDPAVLRRILEDRRLLLLSDPSNQEYKILYAEAKRRQK